MKEMQKLMASMALNATGSSQSNDRIRKEEIFMNEFFERLAGIIPSMDVGERLNTVKNEWTIALKEANVFTHEQLNRGLKRCRDLQFLPPINKFISWCKPSVEELGLPSLLTALREAIKNCREKEYDRVWTHEIVYWAYLRSNTWLLLHAANETVPPDFRAAYEELAAKIANGEALAPIPRVIAPKIEEKRDTETGRAALEALKALFNKKD